MDDEHCAVPSCDGSVKARGWCNRHYIRWKKYGDPTAGQPERIVGDDEARFMAKVAVLPSGCWEWTGATDENGYARFMVNGRNGHAHRWYYERHVGPIGPGQQTDHLCHTEAIVTCPSGTACRHRRCVNPAHLELVGTVENTQRGNSVPAKNGRKTHCVHGHPLTGANLLDRANGHRGCRTCRLESSRRTVRVRDAKAEYEKQRTYQLEYQRRRRAAAKDRAPTN